MSANEITQTRRGAFAAALALAGGIAAIAQDAGADPLGGAALTGHEQDFAWLVGRWSVKHRQLRARLAGGTEWIEFNGTSALLLTMGGLGTIDDNVIEKPSGAYRAMTVRTFDPKAGQWFVWWFDGRFPTDIGSPMKGGFQNGVGTFLGDDTLNGRPIKVRFIWSEITPNAARWEQAFSPDDGATWEVNWVMHFTRVAA